MTTTPMMQQYLEAKRAYPDTLLLFRMGDFYELFFEDAEMAARVLGLALTSRDKGPDAVRMAGFPHHALDGYLRKLIAAGHRAAICEQTEDPRQAKGLVRREVTRVITPGTLTEETLLEPRANNFLAAVAQPRADAIGLAWVEVSTGSFWAADLAAAELADELARIEPAECLIAEDAAGSDWVRSLQARNGVLVTPRPGWHFHPTQAAETLNRHFSTQTLEGFGLAADAPAVAAAGALLGYLQETQKASLRHIARISPFVRGHTLVLDETARRSLELCRTIRDGGRQGSLLGVLDRAVTPMGSRLLATWITAPLTDVEAIDRRLDAVAELVASPVLRQELADLLGGVYDVARLTARISTGRATPRDLGCLRDTLRRLPAIKAKLTARRSALLNDLDARLDLCPQVRAALEAALVDDPPIPIKEGGIIRDSFNPQLDELRDASRGGKQWIARFQAAEIARTGIPSLKVAYNKVFGYYIEITHTHRQKVPADYTRKQTVKNAERYITPELKEYEDRVLRADEQARELETELFSALRDEVAGHTAGLQATAEVLATVDVLGALAAVAASRNYTRPHLVAAPVLEVADGRHPVLDTLLPQGGFVPNDIRLDDAAHLLIITGPNMSGKCVTGDTLVFTDRGLLPIEALKPQDSPVGEFVPRRCVVQGRDGPAQASHFYTGGRCPTIRIDTHRGFTLEGTPEHRIWVRHPDGTESWKRLGDLGQADQVAIEHPIDLWGNQVALNQPAEPGHAHQARYRLPATLNADLAYLLGLLVGDGTLTDEPGTGRSGGEASIAGEFRRIVLEQFGYRVGVKARRRAFLTSSKPIRAFLADNGLGYDDARTRHVPACVLAAPRALVIAFLQGLFDTDGTAEHRSGSVRYSSSSPRLAREVQLLLLNLGILASRHVQHTQVNPNSIVSIDGEDALRFHQVVGFRRPRKPERDRLASAPRGPNRGGIPHLAPWLDQVPAGIAAKDDKPLAFHRVQALHSIVCRPSPTALEAVHSRRSFYDRVCAVSSGEAEVYDLCVPEGQAFVANGFVNHNSTYIRQAALITILAQMGSFVPCGKARIGVADRIYARVGASDELSRGQSTFMVEMIETAQILNTATERSLVILDEIGRGTSTYDGVSLAWAVAEHLHDTVGCRTLFATHYHELAELERSLARVRNYNVGVREWQDEIIFLHKILKGSADKSYGLHVARLAGIPRPVVERARDLLALLESQHLDLESRSRPARGSGPRRRATLQLSLFASLPDPLVDEIRQLDLDRLTPGAALEFLQRLRRRLGDAEPSGSTGPGT